MYYHIRIDYFDNKLKVNQTVYCLDITDIKIVEDKIRKYLAGEKFLFAGTKLSSGDIRYFRVFESQYDIESCKKIADSKIGPNVIWTYTDETVLGVKNICDEITDEIISRIESSFKSSEKNVGDTEEKALPVKQTSRKVFIVHGHDKAVRTEVELMIKKIGFDPIVLFKQPDCGATIIEKLERDTEDIAFAIILYTHCDDGKAKDKSELQPRARQNVVFEHGMMCGLIGRKRVVALVEPGVEIPGDLSGIVYKTLDDHDAWQLSVAREMKAAGLDVDFNRLF